MTDSLWKWYSPNYQAMLWEHALLLFSQFICIIQNFDSLYYPRVILFGSNCHGCSLLNPICKSTLASLYKVNGNIGLIINIPNTFYPFVEKFGGIRTLLKKRVVENHTCVCISAKFIAVLPTWEVCKGNTYFILQLYYNLDFVSVGYDFVYGDVCTTQQLYSVYRACRIVILN